MARDFGKVAGELKDVPKEFQEGLSEGEDMSKNLRPEIIKEELNDAREQEA